MSQTVQITKVSCWGGTILNYVKIEGNFIALNDWIFEYDTDAEEMKNKRNNRSQFH